MGRDRAVFPYPARSLTAGAALAALLGCSGTAPFRPPGAALAVTVLAYHCSGGCGSPAGPIDTVQRGDTALVRLAVADTSGSSTIALVRAPCAVNVTILGGTMLHTLPATPTCPDSGVAVEVGSVPYMRDVVWIVDGSFTSGDYTLRGDIVVDPPVTGRRPVHVR
ncbi:MAG TPA: hypothetical protein VKB45_05770 [Gemmatimonadales bacterium]|nr:hypothetical protein [Gemmatimonadales bacterium]